MISLKIINVCHYFSNVGNFSFHWRLFVSIRRAQCKVKESVYTQIVLVRGSQTVGGVPLVGSGPNFSGSRKSFKININACFVSNDSLFALVLW